MSNNHDLIEWNELSQNSHGGSEQMLRRIYGGDVERELLEKVQIVPSRLRSLDEKRHRIFLANDLPVDPESQFLSQSKNAVHKFHRLVFVSHWQRDQYIQGHRIPYSKCVVIPNAIEIERDIPERFAVIENRLKAVKEEPINLIYHTTPHRGLELLIPVFDKLAETYNIHLHVYSSFEIYGWGNRDEQFKPLFDQIKNHPKMTYYGYRPNAEVREALKKTDIFAYPSIWPETYCISLVEAMAAGCLCVHPSLAALPEVAANWTMMYDVQEDKNAHASLFYGVLEGAINQIMMLRENREHPYVTRLKGQMSYTELFHSWDMRAVQWNHLLRQVVSMPLEVPVPKEKFVYTA